MKKIQFIVDSKGERQAVILPYKDFLRLLELVEDSVDVALIEETKNDQLHALEDVIDELKTEKVS